MSEWFLLGTGLVIAGLGALGLNDTWQAAGVLLISLAVAGFLGG